MADRAKWDPEAVEATVIRHLRGERQPDRVLRRVKRPGLSPYLRAHQPTEERSSVEQPFRVIAWVYTAWTILVGFALAAAVWIALPPIRAWVIAAGVVLLVAFVAWLAHEAWS